ncbi:hemoglobin subunit alpha-3-like [Pyxicephalus adspersus]|uniref:Globin domain-containing protein n=1 Tax=Pyxicephalus adspersus TaxID=30357 RepID=A0AAV3AN35_PYXAD|nr:TPA: hypothetical protein GDO54_011865 [Pyxicephalus adspersus]
MSYITIDMTATEKASLVSLWSMVSHGVNDLGGEAFERLFFSAPQTKRLFTHFDLNHGSADMKTFGGKVLTVFGSATTHLDNLGGILATLDDLLGKNLKVDPDHLSMLTHTILVTLATHFPRDFTPMVQATWYKFISKMFALLTSKRI